MQYRRDYTLGATYFSPWWCSADYRYWAVGESSGYFAWSHPCREGR